MKKSTACALALVCALSLPSCFSLEHRFGTGAGPEAKVEEARQWYALWGLVPLGEVNTRAMAGNTTDYTVKTERSLVDILLNILTGVATVYSQTVQVHK